jgi:carbon monoxide dehydrogenase subunit G
MILKNEFSVGSDIDTVWRELLDMEGVATCLPGATIQATDTADVYSGSMRLKIGPMRVEYRGTATLSAVDEASHTAVITLSAREAKGQGSAMATIQNRLDGMGAGTRVRAETELHITGPQAQFGRGVIEDVGKRVLDEFSQRLEERIARSGGSETGSKSGIAGLGAMAPEPGGSASARAPGPAMASPDELDVGSLMARTPAVRIGAGVLLLALLVILFRRRR